MRGVSQGSKGLPKWKQPAFIERWWALHKEHGGCRKRIAAALDISLSRYSQLKQWMPRHAEAIEPKHPEERREYIREQRQRERGQPALITRSTGRPRYARGTWKGGKRVLTPAQAEANAELRSQELAVSDEMELRDGKPLWDERGRAEARKDDLKAVQSMLRRDPHV